MFDPVPDSSGDLIATALDPARSVVVEACAGSGKTWLLASRIVRLLLAGVAPGEILAITFTRKAAREIEERVVDWLRLLATDSERQVAAFLAERGVKINDETVRNARALFERVVGAQPRLAVNTFHGWFLQLVAAAPLSAHLAGATLVDSGSRLFDEWWQSFAAEVQKEAQKDPQSALGESFVALLREAGLDAARRLVRRGIDRRAEWLAFGAGQSDPLAHALSELRARLGVGETETALAGFFAAGWASDYHAYLGWLELSELETDRKLAHKLAPALNEGAEDGARFAALREAFLTQANAPRARKPSKALDKRFGADGAARFLELHARLGGTILACLAQQAEERAYAFNRHACRVLHAFLAHVDAFKAARRQIDFVDAEWRVLQLLRDEPAAAFLQARLDARYRHVLLDEFQDTNPLQWQILLAWLDAYSDAQRPGVFLVGDPKQSIYRFRRAEPKLFAAAANFLENHFAAARCAQDTTRRNAQPIVDTVNALFLAVPEFAPFREQRSLAGALPGRVELLPLCGEEDDREETGDDGASPREGLRDPLTEAGREPLDSRRAREAGLVAERIVQMVGVWQIEASDATGQKTSRPLRYGDIMLLTRSRTHLATYETALVAANIPFVGASRGGLLATPEARDLVALLEFLVTPAADLPLAQTLRSPVFACSDEELLLLAARPEATWWQRLQCLVAESEEAAPPRLARAARLLAEWLHAADRLPAHDLLDRITHRGEVLARYRLAAPPAARAGVEANLRALLLLSLDLDGGRYPSLPRFIAELKDLRAADANDAPDEGAIDGEDTPRAADAGRVRILTIHGAKGLEAPLVWLLDANTAPRAAEPWDVLVDWAPEAAAPRHFSFVGRKEERGAARQPLFDREAAAAEREELNLLYVAITRARQVFVASGIESGKGGGGTPYRRLHAALEKLGGSGALAHGDELPQCSATAAPIAPTATPDAPDAPLPQVGARRAVPDAAERTGILLHALLERRTGRLAQDGWWRDLGFGDGEYRNVLPAAERLLAEPALQRFFDPAQFRRAWNELEISGSDGVMQRIDRLVDSPGSDDAFWVLDYKSSRSETSRLAAYRAQVAAYCAAVAAVFPGRSVRGALVFADGTLLEVL
ncbi:MAG: UvrD-helicase domain-containing protein [Betaproteobacteria bacterium]|nr:UvrD-helicase domain-containing protein [Betaproteobacteria bacterium]